MTSELQRYWEAVYLLCSNILRTYDEWNGVDV